MENKDLKLLEDYLLGRMDEEERVLFEKRLEHDSDLQKEKQLLEEIVLAIEYDSLKETLDHYEIPKEQSLKGFTSSPSASKRNGARIIKFRPWMVAASILLIGWVGYFLYSNLNSGTGSDLEKIFYPDPGLPTVMGETDRYVFYDAMVDYKAGEYMEAIDKWSGISDVGRDTLDYYTGMAWLNLEKWEEAESLLQQVPEDSSLKTKADWYLVRVYIGLGEFDKAMRTFEGVHTSQEGYQDVKEYLSSKIK